ncbi:MAG: hypothetical protein ABI645_07530 [Pseudomonadota bacterium]
MNGPATELPFSLFEGDGLQRVYGKLRLSRFSRFRLLKRCTLMVLLTWVPVALLAWLGGHYGGGLVATNFFADFAAYAQFLIGLPLFMLAELIIDTSTRGAAREFVSDGIVRPEDHPRLELVNERIRRLRTSLWPDAVCIALALAMSAVILVPEFSASPMPTWHVQNWPMGRSLSLPGWWEFVIAIPVMNYIWLRLIWKIFLWIYYLRRVSRMRLQLHPTHADLTGGIGFISGTQAQFATFILAYGISNVAATVGYEIAILHYDLSKLPVWGPLAAFAVGAPLLFTLPLLMFTRQLYRSKRRALAIFRRRVTEHSRKIEARWLPAADNTDSAAEEIRYLTELTTFGNMFTRIQSMRVVPFDLRSFMQLGASSLGSVATILPILHISGDFPGILESISKFIGHLTGN